MSMNLQGNGYGVTRSTVTVVAKRDQGRLRKPVTISSLWVKYEEGVQPVWATYFTGYLYLTVFQYLLVFVGG
jgi:hypothetical protein